MASSSNNMKVDQIAQICRNNFLQMMYRKIDGAVLISHNERNLDCSITFQTDSILQRFMLRFDVLQLDCNDHLFIYDGAHAVGSPKADITCRNTKHDVGAIFTRTNFVTLKYVTDNWGTEANGFKLVITAFKDPSKYKHQDQQQSECTFGRYNVTDLICDKVNHCADGSDESISTICANTELATVFGLSMNTFVIIIISILVVLCMCVLCVSVCVCRRHGNQHNHHQQQVMSNNINSSYPMDALHGSNGTGIPGVTKLSPGPGNWHHLPYLIKIRNCRN
ncbi:uncharacterized protein LOC103509747 [Diaphorina citri]|uniref:Uncharacterized protein LOC103509747 n=1 Tax=Diaphorina citri TaxID=121845 RepID=A0A3Q0IU93_DIACI|nr:uncharacterized protein LOC103509747 [Diaphorina citri]